MLPPEDLSRVRIPAEAAAAAEMLVDDGGVDADHDDHAPLLPDDAECGTKLEAGVSGEWLYELESGFA